MGNFKVDIGCGVNKKKGFIGIDVIKTNNVDIICDVGKHGIPLKSSSVVEIFSSHFLEHVENTQFLIEEIYRVLEPNGIVEILVPHFSNMDSYHWMHKTYWNVRGFDVFDKTGPYHYYFNVNFEILVKNIEFSGKHKYKPTILEKLTMIKGGSIYEKYFCNLFRANQIRIIMKKIPL